MEGPFNFSQTTSVQLRYSLTGIYLNLLIYYPPSPSGPNYTNGEFKAGQHGYEFTPDVITRDCSHEYGQSAFGTAKFPFRAMNRTPHFNSPQLLLLWPRRPLFAETGGTTFNKITLQYRQTPLFILIFLILGSRYEYTRPARLPEFYSVLVLYQFRN